jgi:hypothetical protein
LALITTDRDVVRADTYWFDAEQFEKFYFFAEQKSRSIFTLEVVKWSVGG